MEFARRGGYAGRGFDAAHAMTVLNLWHPKSADWQTLFALLGEPAVRGQQKTAALRTLSASTDRLPAEVQSELQSLAISIARQTTREEVLPEPDVDERGFAETLAAALDPEYASSINVGAYLRGDDGRRESAAFLAGRLGRDSDVGVLTVLSVDQAPRVRAAAAAALARLIANDQGGEVAVSALIGTVGDQGTLVARAIVGAFGSSPSLSHHARGVLERLHDHISCHVRRSVDNLLSDPT